MRRLGSLLVLLVLCVPGQDGEAQGVCGCAEPPPLPRCSVSTPAPRTFGEVFNSASSLEGRVATVRGVLHRFYSCTARMTASGVEQTCTGQAALIERSGRDERVLYLGEAETTGPFGCSGTEECPCCRVDARDQVVVVTGIMHGGRVRRVASPVICTAY
jgi:hypothetical protein